MELESIILNGSIVITFKVVGVKGIVTGKYVEKKDKFSLKIKGITGEKKSGRYIMKDG